MWAAVVAVALAVTGVVTPPPDGPFHIQFSGTLTIPSNARVVEVDGDDTSAATVRELEAYGVYVVCYTSAGTRENWRADADRYPKQAVGRALAEWPGERWVDIRNPAILDILSTRVARLAAKGCRGVEFDNVDGYTNKTGFPLTAEDQVAFNVALAQMARAAGLSPGLKNATDLTGRLEPYFDWALNEQCVTYRECGSYRPFVAAGKPVWVLEYGQTPFARVCRVTSRYGLHGQIKALALGASAQMCL